ncbi:hypothetical protein C8Q69DRAFT_447313 [Paecilomyces variotii]|uniref:Uncharacterized protein n=1 Tax=Byssochlamys spectabilis TaxID=264951 RepID=A0A443HLE8_BYSSP|nr:hypothetical protein C8Q69DRAFT_447313 [Paecilomyces variotii]RWQ92634.1 hypothetical protein C8Q69DRAFT_447313 [Paecilomyces variotii]
MVRQSRGFLIAKKMARQLSGSFGARLSDGHAWWHFGSLTFWIALLVLFVECRPTNKFVAHIFAGAAGVVLLILLGAAVAYRIASMPKIHLWTRTCNLAVGLRKRRERKKELTYFLLNHERYTRNASKL